MKTLQIVLIDRVTKEIEKVENFVSMFSDFSDLKNRLFELQLGYCQDEKPTISENILIGSNNIELNCIISESESDFFYCAVISKVKIS